MAEKVNVVNYLTKLPLPVDVYYYEEDTYAVNKQTGGIRPNSQDLNQENCHKGQVNQGRSYGNRKREGKYVRDGIYNRDNNGNRNE